MASIKNLRINGTDYTIGGSEMKIETATETNIGGIKIGYKPNNKNYPIELNDDGQAYVSVPWESGGSDGEDNDTKNTVGATVDGTSNALFLVGVKQRGDEYIQSYTTGYGAESTVNEKRCWIEGIKDNTVLNIPNISCEYVNSDTIRLSQIEVKDSNGNINYGAEGQVLISGGGDKNCTWGNLPSYNLELATSEKLGGIKVGYTTNETNKNYAVQLENGKAYVNVPWTDLNVKTDSAPGVNYYLCGSTSSNSSTTGESLVKKSTVYVGYSNNAVYASGGFYESSDERLKNFTERIPIDLDKLSELKKNYFTWKDSENTEQQLGVSAQEIRELYPEIVSEQENGTLTVAYDKLSVIALAAIDELHKKNKELEERLTALENKLK